MRSWSRWLLALSGGLLSGCSKSNRAPEAAPSAPSTWVVRPDGLGPIRIGATVAELEAALGRRPPRADSLDPHCDYLRDPDRVPGVWFMLTEGRVARLDVDSTGPATTEGVRVGDGTEKVQRLYAPRVIVTPHKYTGGEYLTVTPAPPADSQYRMIFETDSGIITRYRVGRLPEVGWIESCS
jgi:hypothetical protein